MNAYASPDSLASEVLLQDAPEAPAFVLRPAKVSPDEYDACRRFLPEAYADTPRGRFLLSLLNVCFSPARLDADTLGYILPHELVATMAGQECDTNFRSGPWFDSLSVWADRMPMELHPYSWSGGKARSLVLQLPPEIERTRRITAMAETYAYTEDDGNTQRPTPERVYLSTGEPVSRRKRQEERRAVVRQREAACQAAPLGSMQAVLLGVLNGHLTEREQTIREAIEPGLPRLWKWYTDWTQTPLPTKKRGKALDAAAQQRHRENVGSLIESLCENHPQWGYTGSGKTTRCHAFGPNAHWLPRDGRKCLLSHLTTFDLASSQLAIGAALWGADVAKAKLFQCQTEGRSVWKDLLDSLSLPAEAKPALKTALYSCQFGMTRRSLRANLVKDIMDCGFSRAKASANADTFLKSAVMTDLLDARDTRIDSIIRVKGVRLVDWEWQGETHRGAWVPLRDGDVLTLLALELQAAEMALMLAAVEVISRHRQVTIVSFLHDGITCVFTDADKQARQKRQIIKAVNNRCESFGFPTYLDLE